MFNKHWWLEHGAEWHRKFESGPAYKAQEEKLAEVCKALDSSQLVSILEVGAGFGRVTKVVHEVFPWATYTVTDITSEIIDGAKEALGLAAEDMVFDIFDLDIHDTTTIAHSSLVVASEVLMHRRPEVVEFDIEALVELSGKYILNIDWYEPGVEVEGEFYQHDYMGMFGRYGSVLKFEIPEARQAIWVTEL